jgi:hypothetical protein
VIREKLQAPALPPATQHGLRLFVILTTPSETTQALRAANSLVVGLGATIALLAPHEVPFPFALNEPPVSIGFTENQLRSIAIQGCRISSVDAKRAKAAFEHDVNIQILLRRDARNALLKALPQSSLVVIRGERRLAAALARTGHQVIAPKDSRSL